MEKEKEKEKKDKVPKEPKQQLRLSDKQIVTLSGLTEQQALEANKLILKLAGDYNTSKSPIVLLEKLLNLFYEGNLDPLVQKNRKVNRVITNWQFNLIEEVYLQIVKQTIGNPRAEEIQVRYYKCLAVISSYIPTGKRIFWALLNYLNERISQESSQEVVRYCKFIFCRIVRQNIRYVDQKLYQTIMPIESKEEQSKEICIFRQLMPTSQELGLVMNRKKIIIQVYMMNGSFIEIPVESFSNVKKCVILCLMQLGMQDFVSKSEHFTLLEYIRLHNGQKIERYLDDQEKVMDVLTRWEQEKKIEDSKKSPPKKYLQDAKSFSEEILETRKFFFTLRIFFKLKEGNPMQVSIFFLQAFANVMNGKLPLREDDFLNLAALKMCSEKTRTSINDLSKTPLSNYIPLNIVQAQSPITPNQMISIIKERYQKLVNHDQNVAMIAYLEYLKAHPLQFSLDFHNVYASEIKSLSQCIKEKALVTIGSQYICICQENSRQIKKKIYIDKLAKWGSSELEIYVVDEHGVRFCFETEQAPFMAFILSKYVQ